MTTPNLGLPEIAAAQAQKHVTHNEALQILDAVVRTRVISIGDTSPPGSPSDGDVYIPGAGATGAWAGLDQTIVFALDGGWFPITPLAAWIVDNLADGVRYRYDGSAWRPLMFAQVASKFYPTIGASTASNQPVPDADTLYLTPFECRMKMTLTSLAIRVVTAGTGSSVKMALWADKNGRPIGAPLAANNTGAATTSNGTTVSQAISLTLHPGVYWVGSVHTGSPLPQCVRVANTDSSVSSQMGVSDLTNVSAIALSIAQAYANDLSALTFTGGESFTDVASNGVPLIYAGT
ncbi:MAG: DUF2793 domain-containing protein [Rhizobiales bacterium]|nr:DUF2793 domain-containing protein [Hyphomicrobiales bacterium]